MNPGNIERVPVPGQKLHQYNDDGTPRARHQLTKRQVTCQVWYVMKHQKHLRCMLEKCAFLQTI